ncbi:hypothetical protein A2U01_0036939, partial [Trifolium medium]|nr:hypothetical protein [Trifolium medium]
MMGRTFLFRVKWTEEWHSGSVLEIMDNKQMVAKIQQQLNEIAIEGTDKSADTTAIESLKSIEVEIPDYLPDDDIVT